MTHPNAGDNPDGIPQSIPVTNLPPLVFESSEPMTDFYIPDNAACFCGSGMTFGECCGLRQSQRTPPYGVFVFENYLDAGLCRDLSAYAEQQHGQRLMVIDQQASSADNIVKVEDERRVAERVDLGPRRIQVNELVKTLFRDLARECTGHELDWLESPDLMRYRPGGFYIKHADNQNLDLATRTWNKVIDRDLSLLIYLNDDFQGGALCFEKFHYRIKPRAGMAVLFPSDSRYLHTAEIVTQGVRYAIVSWASVTGVTKIARQPPDCAIYYD